MIIGEKYGSLTFIGESDFKKDGRRTGNFKCDCGRLHTTTLRNVLKGKTKSCGCNKYKGLTPHNKTINFNYSKDRTFSKVKSQLKESCTKRNIKNNLTDSELYKLVTSSCFYCGKTYEVPIGIDRINNEMNYNVGNCVPCCLVCNRMKLNFSLTEFYNHIYLIYSALNKRGELLETPEMDNQQPSLARNGFEGSTTRSRVLPSNVEDSNTPTSAPDLENVL